jgi:hypothetical protein
MSNSKCILPHKDVHIKTFVSGGFTPVPVLEIQRTEMSDGTFWNTIQLTSRKDALTLANAILEAAEYLPENS